MRLENLPNPFQARTRISFAISAEARVTLEVFDMAGRLVATLLRDELATAGSHQLTFHHPALPRGLYLSRLRVGHDTITRKMVVL